MQSLQEGEIFSLKLIPEDSDRDEKLCGRLPDPAVRSKASPGDDTVHMAVSYTHLDVYKRQVLTFILFH